jgi:hypothetical protein
VLSLLKMSRLRVHGMAGLGAKGFLAQVAAACGAAESTVALTLAKARFWLRFWDAHLVLKGSSISLRSFDNERGNIVLLAFPP